MQTDDRSQPLVGPDQLRWRVSAQAGVPKLPRGVTAITARSNFGVFTVVCCLGLAIASCSPTTDAPAASPTPTVANQADLTACHNAAAATSLPGADSEMEPEEVLNSGLPDLVGPMNEARANIMRVARQTQVAIRTHALAIKSSDDMLALYGKAGRLAIACENAGIDFGMQ